MKTKLLGLIALSTIFCAFNVYAGAPQGMGNSYVSSDADGRSFMNISGESAKILFSNLIGVSSKIVGNQTWKVGQNVTCLQSSDGATTCIFEYTNTGAAGTN